MLLPPDHEKTERIEVVRIADPRQAPRTDELVGERIASWDADPARKALALVAEAPAGDRGRCFTPRWGIRAHSAAGPLFRISFRISFCYACDGARLWGPAVPGELARVHPFDARSAPARELLRRFEAGAGGGAA
ncbi:hypothetical protein [Streptomyces sp. NPDC014894]|uniref:hypothetical protein n=1 Tax=Streptomyces sp. NPDC014894 TaxID=3364931 RepID=UPI0036F5F4C5